jgi:hypothetical protein
VALAQLVQAILHHPLNISRIDAGPHRNGDRISSSGNADPAQLGRQMEKVAELPVPADQIEVLVEHRDALAHVVDGRLQQIAAVLEGFGGIVEQTDGAAPVAGPPLQQQPQHQPRGGRADGAGQQVLGKSQGRECRPPRRLGRPGPSPRFGRTRRRRAWCARLPR